MLVDDITITLKAGNGGNGFSSFLRSRHQPKGGPDGGNGGNGGSIYFQGTDDITALTQFRYKKKVMAEDGIAGKSQKLFGRNGRDTIVYVPLGTHITDNTFGDEFEITDTTTPILVAHGGRGGRGNAEFKSAVNQTPTYAENGRQTPEKEVHLVLKFIADIGLIGLPNAGKSSLLEALTAAHPKIGDYPFTTLEPNLGVFSGKIIADIPGLIEGASEGKGLGIKFLKHIEKTKVLLHCIDTSQHDMWKAYTVVRNELKNYNKELLDKKEIILLTKSDLIDAKELKKKVALFKKHKKEVVTVSAIDDATLEELQKVIIKLVKMENESVDNSIVDIEDNKVE